MFHIGGGPKADTEDAPTDFLHTAKTPSGPWTPAATKPQSCNNPAPAFHPNGIPFLPACCGPHWMVCACSIACAVSIVQRVPNAAKSWWNTPVALSAWLRLAARCSLLVARDALRRLQPSGHHHHVERRHRRRLGPAPVDGQSVQVQPKRSLGGPIPLVRRL